jgi:hypothetical protein
MIKCSIHHHPAVSYYRAAAAAAAAARVGAVRSDRKVTGCSDAVNIQTGLKASEITTKVMLTVMVQGSTAKARLSWQQLQDISGSCRMFNHS